LVIATCITNVFANTEIHFKTPAPGLLNLKTMKVNETKTLFYVTEIGLRVLPGYKELVALRMKGHSKVGNRSAIKLEWEAYARAVEADAWARGAPSSQLEDLAKSLAQV
jgi:hypothetical protein